jgi:Ca-activated chloride channel family protein
MTKRKKSSKDEQRTRALIFAGGAILFAMIMCVSVVGGGAFWFINSTSSRIADDSDFGPTRPTWAADSAELQVAVSPVMAPVLADLAAQFNAQEQRTPDGRTMSVAISAMEPERMVDAALDAPPFQAVSPDSSLWLDRLEQRWAGRSVVDTANQLPVGQARISQQVRYAVSPIVIAAWESAARDLGWPDNPVGWQTIQQQATADPNFKWNHPSTNTAAGLLATLAEFYAGAGLTRGLTAEAATAPETLEYVQAVEATVRFYGEGEEVIVARLADEGRNFLDAFVAQERVVIDWNQRQDGERLVAIYPAEGTLWTDHPLALLELGSGNETAVTANQRLTYAAFADFLTAPETQQALLAAGYRPADLSIALDGPGSPFAGSDAVDWREPQTTLQMPSPAVVDVVQNTWYYTKRPTNVYLVVDTSGSMEGEKLVLTQRALQSFVAQIQGNRDAVGLVEFGSDIKSFLPVRALDGATRADLVGTIERMEAFGSTALIDATIDAAVDLKAQGTNEAINALVVMTDGRENESNRDLRDLQRVLAGEGPPIVIFTIAFGRNADEGLLYNMATIGDGQFRRADETDIEELYRIISTYF